MKAVYAYLLLGVTLLVVLIYVGVEAKTLSFAPVTGEKIVGLLTPLFVIALFLERAQEVFVTAWREPQKRVLQANAGAAQQLAQYQAETQRIAFLFGFVVSALVSIVGVRALEQLVTLSQSVMGRQLVLFKTVDVLLTAAIIGGGSDGIHKMVSVITDFLDMTRGKIQGSAPQQPQQPAQAQLPAAAPQAAQPVQAQPPVAQAALLSQAAPVVAPQAQIAGQVPQPAAQPAPPPPPAQAGKGG